MRYPADKVKDGILHPEPDVREAAVHYFADSFSPDPTIMPLAIQGIEKYGYDNAFSNYFFMQELVQTDETVRWLIQQLRTLGEPTTEEEAEPVYAYISALTYAAPDVLKNHEVEILALDALDDESRDAISEQIWFPSRSGEELWGDLEEFCQTAVSEEEITEEDLDFAYRVVRALARHRDQYENRVLAMIRGTEDDTGYWEQGLAIRLAGEMKLESAIPVLMSTLDETNDDWINDECDRALAKIGSEAVVEQFVAVYDNCEWFERMSIACALQDIHSDLAVRACLDLLPIEADEEIEGLLIQAILFNFSTQGIEPARRYILERPKSPQVLEVRSTLLTACKLMGKTFLEFDDWLDDSKQDIEFRRQWYEEHSDPRQDFEAEDLDDDFDDNDDFDDDDNFEDDDFDDDLFDEFPPDTSARSAWVARNDPCPCGSGEKFKNCCLGKMPEEQDTDPNHASAMSGGVRGNLSRQFPVGMNFSVKHMSNAQ